MFHRGSFLNLVSGFWGGLTPNQKECLFGLCYGANEHYALYNQPSFSEHSPNKYLAEISCMVMRQTEDEFQRFKEVSKAFFPLELYGETDNKPDDRKDKEPLRVVDSKKEKVTRVVLKLREPKKLLSRKKRKAMATTSEIVEPSLKRQETGKKQEANKKQERSKPPKTETPRLSVTKKRKASNQSEPIEEDNKKMKVVSSQRNLVSESVKQTCFEERAKLLQKLCNKRKDESNFSDVEDFKLKGEVWKSARCA